MLKLNPFEKGLSLFFNRVNQALFSRDTAESVAVHTTNHQNNFNILSAFNGYKKICFHLPSTSSLFLEYCSLYEKGICIFDLNIDIFDHICYYYLGDTVWEFSLKKEK